MIHFKIDFSRLRMTIGTKIVGLIAILLLSSVISLVWVSTQIYTDADTALIQQTNSDAAYHLATQVRGQLLSITEKMRFLGTLLSKPQIDAQTPSLSANVSLQPSGTAPSAVSLLVNELFNQDSDLLALYLLKQTSEHEFDPVSQGFSPQMLALWGDPKGDLLLPQLKSDAELSLSASLQGEVQISTLKIKDDEGAIALSLPFIKSDQGLFTHVLLGVFRQDKLLSIFSESNLVTSYLVNRHGGVIAHRDTESVGSKKDLSHLPIVQQLLAGKLNNAQTSYQDPATHEEKLGAFRVIGFAHLGVVAEVNAAKALEASKKVVYRSGLVAWIILCISILIGYIYSNTISYPLRLLSQAAEMITQGQFDIRLTPKGHDEIAHLSSTFNHMAKGLEERDQVKSLFNKFHNKEITDKLLSGEVKLGGERKVATVFFSDIRGFTSLSESLEPEQVVEMLNEYMTHMVAVIRSYGGVVDKYVGDAIMALWGVPMTGTNDSEQAVRACIAMREELYQLNALRVSRDQPVLRIGMGLNKGPLIAGNIGSNEKMEYTVIGDAVNIASRIESMTKEFGTDLLVSKSIYDETKEHFMYEKAASTFVKGKTEAVEIFKVQGYYSDTGKAMIIETPYSSYAAEKSDKVVHS